MASTNDDTASKRKPRGGVLFWRGLAVAVVVFFCVGSAVFAYAVLEKIERVIVVVEDLNRKVDRATAASLQLRDTVVAGGAAALETIDAEQMMRSAAEETERLRKATAELAREWVSKMPGQEPAAEEELEKNPDDN